MSGIEREMRRRTIGAGEARVAIIRRRYDAPVADVWEACTSPGRLARWFLPVSGDLRAGGRFEIKGNAGGEIVTCEPPRRLSLTWIYGDRPVDEVELTLSPTADGGTLLELEHATVLDSVEWEGTLVDVIAGVGSGWELPLMYALPAYLRGELPDAPAEEWFVIDDAVKEADRRAAEAWAAVVAEADRKG
jgi:uncharacterized protein YndB with AHSA1/START domain